MMDWGLCISRFYKRAGSDQRIGPVHIALYFALLHEAGKTGINLLLPARENLMAMAKIRSTATYHKVLRELNQYGYIGYKPNFRKGLTRITLADLL